MDDLRPNSGEQALSLYSYLPTTITFSKTVDRDVLKTAGGVHVSFLVCNMLLLPFPRAVPTARARYDIVSCLAWNVYLYAVSSRE